MNNLEKKIKKILDLNQFTSYESLAHDIADIAEKEYEEKFFEFVKVTDRYEKENAKLETELKIANEQIIFYTN